MVIVMGLKVLAMGLMLVNQMALLMVLMMVLATGLMMVVMLES